MRLTSRFIFPMTEEGDSQCHVAHMNQAAFPWHSLPGNSSSTRTSSSRRENAKLLLLHFPANLAEGRAGEMGAAASPGHTLVPPLLTSWVYSSYFPCLYAHR